MIELFNSIAQLGIVPSITAVIIVILLVPTAVDSWKKFLESIGLVSKKEIHEHAQDDDMSYIKNELGKINNRFNEVDGRLDTINEKLNQTKERVEEVSEQNDKNKIESLRFRILDYENKLTEATRNGHHMSRESFNNVLDSLPNYNRLCEERHVENDKMTRAIKHIRTVYAQEEADGWKYEAEARN